MNRQHPGLLRTEIGGLLTCTENETYVLIPLYVCNIFVGLSLLTLGASFSS